MTHDSPVSKMMKAVPVLVILLHPSRQDLGRKKTPLIAADIFHQIQVVAEVVTTMYPHHISQIFMYHILVSVMFQQKVIEYLTGRQTIIFAMIKVRLKILNL